MDEYREKQLTEQIRREREAVYTKKDNSGWIFIIVILVILLLFGVNDGA